MHILKVFSSLNVKRVASNLGKVFPAPLEKCIGLRHFSHGFNQAPVGSNSLGIRLVCLSKKSSRRVTGRAKWVPLQNSHNCAKRLSHFSSLRAFPICLRWNCIASLPAIVYLVPRNDSERSVEQGRSLGNILEPWDDFSVSTFLPHMCRDRRALSSAPLFMFYVRKNRSDLCSARRCSIVFHVPYSVPSLP